MKVREWVGICAQADEVCWMCEPVQTDSKDEAIILLAKQLELLPGEKLRLARKADILPEFDGEAAADDALERANENLELPCGEGELDYTTAQRDELATLLGFVLDYWANKYRIKASEWLALDCEIVEIPEAGYWD